MRCAGLLVVLCAASAPPATAQPQVFLVDAEASQVRIELGRAGLLRFLGHGHAIVAPIADGRIEAYAADLPASRVELRWEAVRLAIVPGTEPAGDIPKVESGMRGADVLDAEGHPDITFVSSSVTGRADAEGAYRLVVRGMLTLKGRPTAIEVPLEVRSDAEALVASGNVRLRLRDLGVAPPSVAGVVKVSNDFRISFEIRARRDTARP